MMLGSLAKRGAPPKVLSKPQDLGGKQGGQGLTLSGRPNDHKSPKASPRGPVTTPEGKGSETTIVVDMFRVRLSLLKRIRVNMKPD